MKKSVDVLKVKYTKISPNKLGNNNEINGMKEIWPFKIYQDEKNRPFFEINLGKKNKKFYPEDLLSLYLKKLFKIFFKKIICEENLEDNIYESLRLNRSFSENRNENIYLFDLEFLCRCLGLCLSILIETSKESPHITEINLEALSAAEIKYFFFNDTFNDNINFLKKFRFKYIIKRRKF